MVTGAGRGIGLAIARACAGAGARLALLDVSPDVKRVAAELDAPVAVADLADPVAAESAMQGLVDELSGIDILVNNAGIFELRPLLALRVEEWDRMLAVNARSMLVTTQVAARAMIAAGTGGTIVNLASMAAKRPAADQAHYAASKAAVVALTQASALELGAHGITANCICPGYVLTEMGSESRTPEQVTEWSSLSPLGRCATPEDVARVAVFLASSDAGYLTGQAVNVTGGMVMH